MKVTFSVATVRLRVQISIVTLLRMANSLFQSLYQNEKIPFHLKWNVFVIKKRRRVTCHDENGNGNDRDSDT